MMVSMSPGTRDVSSKCSSIFFASWVGVFSEIEGSSARGHFKSFFDRTYLVLSVNVKYNFALETFINARKRTGLNKLIWP